MIGTVHHVDYTVNGWEVVLPDPSRCESNTRSVFMWRTSGGCQCVKQRLFLFPPCVWPPRSNVVKVIPAMVNSSDAEDREEALALEKWWSEKHKADCWTDNMSKRWMYLDAALARAVLACRLWACAAGLFFQHCLVQGTRACRSSCTSLMIKRKQTCISFFSPQSWRGWWWAGDPTVITNTFSEIQMTPRRNWKPA